MLLLPRMPNVDTRHLILIFRPNSRHNYFYDSWKQRLWRWPRTWENLHSFYGSRQYHLGDGGMPDGVVDVAQVAAATAGSQAGRRSPPDPADSGKSDRNAAGLVQSA